MIIRVDTWPAATKGVDMAADWFDRQRPGLGRHFITEVDRTVARIAEHPESCQRFYSSLRRAVLRRFHYAVVYRVEADAVQIIGVFDCRRRATELLRRLAAPAAE
jgi:plasmid stabilization system protein ParE